MKKGLASRPELAHIAKAIQTYLDANDMSMNALGEKIGVPGRNKSSVVTNWLHAVGAPSEPYRSRLAKVLDVTPGFLTRQEQAIGPARKALMLVPKKEAALVAEGPAEARLLRSFEEHGDGTVTVRLNSRIPLDKAKEVFKILMDVSL